MPESDAFNFEHAVPTGNLRWHEGKDVWSDNWRTLQQEYSIQISEGQSLKEIRREWRDIPTEIEK